MALYLLHRLIVRLFDEDNPASGVECFAVILNSNFKGVIILPCLKDTLLERRKEATKSSGEHLNLLIL
jgi:hypothetical protein